jgi:hypothetical protein
MDFKFNGDDWDRTEINDEDWYTVTSPNGHVVIRKEVSARLDRMYNNTYYRDVIPWNRSGESWQDYEMDDYFDLINGEWKDFPYLKHKDNEELMDRVLKDLEKFVTKFDEDKAAWQKLEDRVAELERIVEQLVYHIA